MEYKGKKTKNEKNNVKKSGRKKKVIMVKEKNMT